MNKKTSYPLLDSLKDDIEFYNDSIREVSDDILDNNVSDCPIFVAHKNEVSLGHVIMDKDDYNRIWTINATIVEELVQKKLILENNLERFKRIFKDPRKYICVFLISEKGGNFIFIPFNKV